ncbi:MAG: bifunctional UDP-N-acetylglucosamine diphosphorylase/glucosamine-1-phosphate N-acetyltransferase GlmU [Deltaproteobacteria bacterium]|nr:bifunctional UDP-N-acetylglucosamine diphosphorylase/glucosamine-1-phosphate N-acetyltransferase GlmU [Deltaproteobacteria bacterium]
MSDLTAVVLAAGLGKRMKSQLPKVLHPVAGRPLVHYPIAAALQVGAIRAVVVVGRGRQQVEAYLQKAFGDRVSFATQEPQLGTGHAVLQALPSLPADASRILIVYGDTPLLVVSDLDRLCEAARGSADAPLAMLTCDVSSPQGYGRILRGSDGKVIGIREDRDLRSDAERALTEVNPGMYCVKASFLREAVARLKADNAQGEYYLTDLVAMAVAAGGVIDVPGSPSNLVGVNDRCQLAQAEELMQARIIERMRLGGATVGSGAVIDDTVEAEPDARIESNVVLRGATRIGESAHIDAGCVITDSHIGPGAWLKPYSIVTSSRVGAKAQIGPFAHLRPDSDIGEEAHVGNFVETKKTTMHRGSKANHLAYLGDGEIGEGANIGAGTIFCNYDGFQKHKTTIGKGAFIGSDSQLVAPVVVGDNAYVGTGSTITKDVPQDALAIGRARQENKEGYAARLRGKLAAAKAAAKAADKK